MPSPLSGSDMWEEGRYYKFQILKQFSKRPEINAKFQTTIFRFDLFCFVFPYYLKLPKTATRVAILFIG